MSAPYRSTPVFDETTLPAGLRGEHRTKSGVWGVIRVIEGQLLLRRLDRQVETVVTPARPALVLPEQRHRVVPMGRMRMRVDFYDEPPALPGDHVAGGK
ncbi:MAG TPA: DUF1971 domain-containing protein [Candidatus Sulfotelmatobacter sp.]|nr:DUF1971 domain-containing protein [Candidatus Sulfotelmatobacter sp.]